MKNTRLQQKLPRVPMAKPGRVKQQACGSNARWEPSQEKSVEADWASNRDARVDLLGLNTCQSRQLSKLTTDRKAGCGKTARTVWREGRGSMPRSYPYPDWAVGRRRGLGAHGVTRPT